MNRLKEIFINNHNGPLINKWDHYFDVYDSYFSRYCNQSPVILEIGVSYGGSLYMWKDYFGPGARIFGIDINPACKALETENITIYIGSQTDTGFLEQVCQEIPAPDIIIDDGGHMMCQQITAFETLYQYLKEGGIYLCEDVHTSYWLEYGGGYRRKSSFLEFSKKLIDYLNAWHSRQKALQPNNYTKTLYGLHYYDSIVLIEKKSRIKPFPVNSGLPTYDIQPPTLIEKRKYHIKHFALYIINYILRLLGIKGIIWR